MKKEIFIARLFSKTAITINGCWIWKGSRSGNYGDIQWNFKRYGIHRFSYQEFVGPIPEGRHIHHNMEVCTSTLCWNPAHLVPVEPDEHPSLGQTITAANSVKTHCIHGHPFSEENTHITPEGHRSCRECYRASCRSRYKRKHAPDREVLPLNRLKTHCNHGHPFDEANTYVSKDGKRMCQACCRDRMRQAYHKAKTNHSAPGAGTVRQLISQGERR